MEENLAESVESNIEKLVDGLIKESGLELVDIELKNQGRSKILRIFVDKENGVNIDDCALLSRELGTLLDVNDIISSRYTLEVSSPGLRRPIKKEEDFKRFSGKKVKIKTKELIENRKNFTGTLRSCENGIIDVEIDNINYSIPLELVSKANLEIDF